MRLKDKVAIVTGAARGIGEAMILRFVEEGARVTLCDVDANALKEVESKVNDMNGQCFLAVGDISQKAFVQSMVEDTVKTLGDLDIMVNNAAITK